MKTFIVLGMHRSATSLIAKSLANEISMGTDMLAGHWEDKRFIRLNTRILSRAGGSWDKPPSEKMILAVGNEFNNEIRTLVYESGLHKEYWGWKDPRTTLTIRLYTPHLTNPHFICCFREPREVAISLQKRNEMSIKQGLELAEIYNSRLLLFLKDFTN